MLSPVKCVLIFISWLWKPPIIKIFFFYFIYALWWLPYTSGPQITKLLEKEGVSWTEEGNGWIISIQVDEIDPRKLSFFKWVTHPIFWQRLFWLFSGAFEKLQFSVILFTAPLFFIIVGGGGPCPLLLQLLMLIICWSL